MKELFTLFSALLNDPESLEVRITTVRCVMRVPEHGRVADGPVAHLASLHSTLIKMIRVKSYVDSHQYTPLAMGGETSSRLVLCLPDFRTRIRASESRRSSNCDE